MHQLTDCWWELFVNRTDGTLRARRDGWYFDPWPLTRQDFNRALQGRQSLGVYASDPHGFARWLCLDADTDADRLALVAIAGQMADGTYLFELSRRGAHLWRFCPPTPWQEVQAYGAFLTHGTRLRCEVFPKGPGRTGVRLPLTRHPKSRECYPAVDPRSAEVLGIETLLALHSAPLPIVPLSRAVPTSASGMWDGGDYETLRREVEAFTRLRQYGPERAIGRCPFHDDRHPSFSILGGFWRCWAGCGQGGLLAFRKEVGRRGWR